MEITYGQQFGSIHPVSGNLSNGYDLYIRGNNGYDARLVNGTIVLLKDTFQIDWAKIAYPYQEGMETIAIQMYDDMVEYALSQDN